MSETSDLRAMMDIVANGHRDAPTEALPWSVLEGLMALVPCDSVTVPENDLVHRRELLQQTLRCGGWRNLRCGAGVLTAPRESWNALWDFAPCGHAERTGEFGRAVLWSDFYSQRELRKQPIMVDQWAAFRHGLTIHLAAGGPAHRRSLCFWRMSGPDFSDRDRAVIEFLRPNLAGIYREGPRRRAGLPRLSPREWEVLRLADEGHGNAEIAGALHISVATVRKHFEHIFDRIGVRSRAAAAALLLPPYR